MGHSAIPPRKIVIVGGGTAGWMSASLILKAWANKGTDLTLIESEDIGTIGVGEGSTPSLRDFFRQLEIPESEWMPECNATYKCGIGFPNWSTNNGFESYFHPFFSKQDLTTGNAFMQNACIRRRGGDAPAHPDNFWVSTQLAAHKKSPIPQEALPFESDYGYHFDSGLLGQFLKRRALKLGMSHITGTVKEVTQNDNGDIESLITQSNDEIQADFFIDCTGFSAYLIEKVLKVPFNSYKDSLLNDRAVAIASTLDNSQPIPSHTASEALSCGWAWKIPLANRYGNGYVYSSNYLSEEEAEAELRAHIGPSCNNMKARHLKLRVGRREKHWCNNVLAVGLSQGFIEPLEATALMLIQYTIDRFIHYFEKGSEKGQSIDEQRTTYNNKVNANFEGIKDYILAHYHLNTRYDSEYWQANRDNPLLSTRLKTILKAWDDGLDFEAALTQFKGELSYMRPSWYCLLAGMGRFPEELSTVNDPLKVASATKALRHCQELTDNYHDHRDNLMNTYADKWPDTEQA